MTKQDSSLWIRSETEYGWMLFRSGTIMAVQNEYRKWGHVHKPLKKHGCAHCGKPLFDRLTHIIWMDKDGNRQEEHHLNSGLTVEELRKLRVSGKAATNYYLERNGEVVQRYAPWNE